MLEALLDKHADTGVADLENIDVLKINPFLGFGTPVFIVNKLFNGKANYEKALKELKEQLYEAA